MESSRRRWKWEERGKRWKIPVKILNVTVLAYRKSLWQSFRFRHRGWLDGWRWWRRRERQLHHRLGLWFQWRRGRSTWYHHRYRRHSHLRFNVDRFKQHNPVRWTSRCKRSAKQLKSGREKATIKRSTLKRLVAHRPQPVG